MKAPAATHNRPNGTRCAAYNLCEPRETQTQFYFSLRADAPTKLKRGYVISNEAAEHVECSTDGSALSLARALLTEYERYIYTSDKAEIKALIAYLETTERQDESDAMHHAVALAEWEVGQAQERLNDAREALADYLAEQEVA